MKRFWISVCIMLMMAGIAQAQDAPPSPTPNDDLTISPINFDQVVADTITQKAIYDWWQISVSADDEIVVEMQAYEGLAPLIGILSPEQELVARSDEQRPPEPNGLAAVQYRVPTSGVYTIAATREGNMDGTTTGVYQLRVIKVNAIPERENDLAPVEFRCDELVAANALMLSFREEVPAALPTDRPYREQYRATLYGQSDFMPLILADADLVKTGRLDCSRDASAVLGNTYTLPGAEPVTIAATEQAHAAQMTLQNTSTTDEFGEVRFTFGSLDGGTGRYVLILEGLALQVGDDSDTLLLRPGPLAAAMPITVYVVGENPGRLDVSVYAYRRDTSLLAHCDDAGRGQCADVPSFAGAGGTFVNGETPSIVGDRFDAGVSLPAGLTEPLTIEINSGDTFTHGRYTVFIIGELPALP